MAAFTPAGRWPPERLAAGGEQPQTGWALNQTLSFKPNFVIKWGWNEDDDDDYYYKQGLCAQV